jgi:hypothetical protein
MLNHFGPFSISPTSRNSRDGYPLPLSDGRDPTDTALFGFAGQGILNIDVRLCLLRGVREEVR